MLKYQPYFVELLRKHFRTVMVKHTTNVFNLWIQISLKIYHLASMGQHTFMGDLASSGLNVGPS